MQRAGERRQLIDCRQAPAANETIDGDRGGESDADWAGLLLPLLTLLPLSPPQV